MKNHFHTPFSTSGNIIRDRKTKVMRMVDILKAAVPMSVITLTNLFRHKTLGDGTW